MRQAKRRAGAFGKASKVKALNVPLTLPATQSLRT
jgi:hypothetical protein